MTEAQVLYQRKWRKANPDKCNRYQKTYRSKNRARVKSWPSMIYDSRKHGYHVRRYARLRQMQARVNPQALQLDSRQCQR